MSREVRRRDIPRLHCIVARLINATNIFTAQHVSVAHDVSGSAEVEAYAICGSGNTLLHNVVGGCLGVFEGNGGDLRIGLSRQSLHDGDRWVHEPLRLTVVIDAPQAAIEAVIAKHAVVGQLIKNGWLHLWRFDATGLVRFDQGTWRASSMG